MCAHCDGLHNDAGQDDVDQDDVGQVHGNEGNVGTAPGNAVGQADESK